MSFARTHGAPPIGTLIVPTRNAESFLRASLDEVRAWLDAHAEAWELIVVDDGSTDGTAAIAEAFARSHPGTAIQVVRFDEHHGKGFAVRAGLDRSRARFAVFTDCDLAFPMSNVDRVLSRLKAGADAAVACRVDAESTYLIRPNFFSYLFTRHIAGRVFNWICRAVALPLLRDTQAGLKGFRVAAVRPLLPRLRLDGFSFDVELLRGLSDRGARIDEVAVDFRYDREPSTVRFVVDALQMARDLVIVRWRSWRGQYARDARGRGLMIHADDFGLAPGVNRAIREGLLAGTLDSASILLGGPHADAALRWAASRPEFDFGAHLNLTQGRPVLAPDLVPTLVDRSGRFRGLGPFALRVMLGRVRFSEIALEWRAQLEAARRAGVRISHLDSHQHVHLFPPIFRSVAASLARQEGLAIRVMDGPVVLAGAHGGVKGLVLALASLLAVGWRGRRRVAVHGVGLRLRNGRTFDALRHALDRARPGTTIELVVHPGYPDEPLRVSRDGYREGRRAERALLVSEELRSWRHAAAFAHVNYHGPRLISG